MLHPLSKSYFPHSSCFSSAHTPPPPPPPAGQDRPCCGACLAGPFPTRLGPAREPAPRKGRLYSHVSTPTLHSPITKTQCTHWRQQNWQNKSFVTTATYGGEQAEVPQFCSFLRVRIGKGCLMVGAWSGRLHAHCKQAQHVHRLQTAQTGGNHAEHRLPLLPRHGLQTL